MFRRPSLPSNNQILFSDAQDSPCTVILLSHAIHNKRIKLHRLWNHMRHASQSHLPNQRTARSDSPFLSLRRATTAGISRLDGAPTRAPVAFDSVPPASECPALFRISEVHSRCDLQHNTRRPHLIANAAGRAASSIPSSHLASPCLASLRAYSVSGGCAGRELAAQ